MRNATLTKSHGLFFEGGGKRGWGRGFNFMMCVCLSHSHDSFSPQIFFWGKGEGGRWGPFFQIPSLIFYLLRSRLIYFKKRPPQAELYLL